MNHDTISDLAHITSMQVAIQPERNQVIVQFFVLRRSSAMHEQARAIRADRVAARKILAHIPIGIPPDVPLAEIVAANSNFNHTIWPVLGDVHFSATAAANMVAAIEYRVVWQSPFGIPPHD
jgi:predicted trehalose synthase